MKNDITLAQARKELKGLGFKFDKNDKTLNGCVRFGTTEAESYPMGKDHFTPRFRSVWISEESKHYDFVSKNRYHISSVIHGTMRRYRCRQSYQTQVGNIFGMGRTLKEALSDFIYKFKTKEYNSNV